MGVRNSWQFWGVRRLTGVNAVAVSIALLGTAAGLWAADDRATHKQEKQALEEFNSLIGGWKGVGQPQRGSTKGAWTESMEWVWDLKKGSVALDCTIKEGQLWESARLTFNPDKKVYLLTAHLPDKTERKYTGSLSQGKLVLESAPGPDHVIHQIQVTRLNEKRTLVLFQTREEDQERATRVAEVGYTREGTKLAVEGAGEPKCIVTGGKGTMSTTYKGKTYWFCCTGCRDAFHDDPDGVIEAAAKKEADEVDSNTKKPAKKPAT